MKKLSLVVPCYNEEESVNLFYQECERVFKTMSGLEFEYIFIDDGSKDNTLKLLRELNKKDAKAKYISFSRNFGKEAGILAGLKKSEGDFVVLIDADLQHPPKFLPEMYSYLKDGEYDSVATRRENRKGEPVIRSFFSRNFYKFMNKNSDAKFEQNVMDFRMMNRQYVNEVLKITEKTRFTKGIFAWLGFKTKWMKYENVERVAGETAWSFKGLYRYAIDGIFAFSKLPLRLVQMLGNLCLGITVLGTISSIALLVLAILNIVSFTPLIYVGGVTVISLFTFIQLFALGVVGNYVDRVYTEAKDRPVFVVRETEENNK